MLINFKANTVKHHQSANTQINVLREDVVVENDEKQYYITSDIVEDSIADIAKYLNDQQPFYPVQKNLKKIAKSANSSDSQVFQIIKATNFMEMVFRIISFESDPSMVAEALFCVSRFLCSPECRNYFISIFLFKQAVLLISHEDDKIARESLHIVSCLIREEIEKGYFHRDVKNDILPPNDNGNDISNDNCVPNNDLVDDEIDGPVSLNSFIYNVAENIKISSKHEIYCAKIFYSIIKYERNDFLNRHIYPYVILLYNKYMNDDTLPFIVGSLYHILLSNFGSFHFLSEIVGAIIRDVNEASSTTSNAKFLCYAFKILTLIIDRADVQTATKYVQLITPQQYAQVVQDHEFCVVKKMLKIIVFLVFSGGQNAFEFFTSSSDHGIDLILLMIHILTSDVRFDIKKPAIEFIFEMMKFPTPQKIIEELIDEDFLLECAFFLDSDDIHSVNLYLGVLKMMIEYATMTSNKCILDSIKSDLGGSDIIENLQKILEQIQCDCETGFICNYIVSFYREWNLSFEE